MWGEPANGAGKPHGTESWRSLTTGESFNKAVMTVSDSFKKKKEKTKKQMMIKAISDLF